MVSISARGPTRVDLAGGTLDLWPVHQLLDYKTTVNVAIDLAATIEISDTDTGVYSLRSSDQELSVSGSFAEVCDQSTLPLFGLCLQAFWSESLPAIHVTSKALSPAGAGIGGSSCLTIVLGAALQKAKMAFGETENYIDESSLVRTAQDIEARLIRAPTGCQDYWGAVRGGTNIIEFPFGRTSVTTLRSRNVAEEINKRMIVCYSGKSRDSAINNWEIYKRVFDGDADLLSAFNQIGKTAEMCAQAFRNDDVPSALGFSAEEWQLRCQLWPGIQTTETIAIDKAAKLAGAGFTRVCGAGGGGVMAIFSDGNCDNDIITAVEKVGGKVLNTQVSGAGLQVDLK